MSRLVLGPLLRYVDETCAAVWAEVDRPGTVRVTAGEHVAEARTFTVHGHHFALAELDGLPPGAALPYTVDVDGERVWPEPDSPFPASVIRTRGEGRGLRLLFGSCRTSVPHDMTHILSHGVDVLRAYGVRMAAEPPEEWPDLLLMLGDQVYADEPDAEMKEYIAARRGDEEPRGEVADFEEYAELYRRAWTDPEIRWLMSTLSTAMIFDDHDLRDDWNTSRTWREEMLKLPWWRRRVVAGLGAYWVYQHLGNLSPSEREADAVFKALRENDGDGAAILDEFALRADEDPASYRWSFARDAGGSRLIVLDSRCARVLDPGARSMLDEGEWAWLDAHLTGDVDHLVIGSSLPVLLPSGLHQIEGWNEAVCAGAWGARAARVGERIRQAVDLEHWAAFRRSFDRLAGLVKEVAAGRRGAAPATILFLSGDIHYSYLARVRRSRVYQVVCSPIRNPLGLVIRIANAVASLGVASLIGGLFARAAGLSAPPYRWKIQEGPWFHNSVATLDLRGRDAVVRWHTAKTATEPPELTPLKTVPL
ncbi:alkaline phosphatase D family protein [Bailinhaonella thermotolerans]|uniref:Alkaline phosphatase family protein n=1 Tax=Bailinhaonella thermotolerans TaxID=1070861 RepID=A0A3A4A001_9ACTN|nr:alkaline phosphatase D family protein [Bailinhaonella thermotolerans]RJL21484.1 alkaline phosphatase family protein [Bailinhaonella thermotolerans]